jgi:DNA-binding NarL/FixJ family response regulator
VPKSYGAMGGTSRETKRLRLRQLGDLEPWQEVLFRGPKAPRDQAIIRRFRDGESIADIARSLDTSSHRVQQVIDKAYRVILRHPRP